LKTYKQIIKEYSKELREVTHIPAKEVEILLLHLLEKNTIWLHLNYDKECSCEIELKKLVQRRATEYPIEYITKKASFYGEMFEVQDGVLIPRPETEILIDKALEVLKDIKSPKILEIGVGSGVISIMLALLVEDIEIVSVDINDKALELAKRNAIKHNVKHKIKFIKSDLFTDVPVEIKFDMVVSNPPYIADDYKLPKNVKFEPSNALFGGKVGDELLKDIIDITLKKKIKYLLCEMGYDQKKPLNNYVSENYKINKIKFYKDYEDFDRGFLLKG